MRIIGSLVRWSGRALERVFVAVLTVGLLAGGLAYANYTATQGTGTNFASVVISMVHYMGIVICDATVGVTQCAAVKPASTAAVATDESLVTQLNPDSPGIIPLGAATQANSVPVVLATDSGALGYLTPSSATAAGITPVVCGSAVSSCVLKNATGNLFSVYAECSAACWLQVFNSTSAPSNGSTTAGNAANNMVECVPIAAGGIGAINYSLTGPPAVYSTGITAAISSTTCATLTLATTGFIHGMVK